MMKILCLELLQKEVLIWRSSLPVEICQLAERFESSKATACHIKQVAEDLQATQISLMRHQQTELPTNKHNKKRRPTGKLKPTRPLKAQWQIKSRNNTTIERHIRYLTTVINVVIPFTHRDTTRKYQCKVCNKYGHFSSLCYQKKTQVHYKNNCRNPRTHQLHAGPMYAEDSSNLSHSEESSSDESFCLQL